MDRQRYGNEEGYSPFWRRIALNFCSVYAWWGRNFRRFVIRNTADRITAISSAATMEIQMPSIPQNTGKISTAETWNTNVRRNEIIAELRPSLRAVKKPEVKMENPISRKDRAKILKPDTVRSKSAASYPTNSRASGRRAVQPP